MADQTSPTIKLDCPCCGATLVVDPALAVVLRHEQPPPQYKAKAPELKDAGRLLREEATQRDQKYRDILDAEKGKSKVLDRKFQELFKKAKDEPIEKPLKDIDLD